MSRVENVTRVETHQMAADGGPLDHRSNQGGLRGFRVKSTYDYDYNYKSD